MKIDYRDGWSESSPVQLEPRGVRGSVQRSSSEAKANVLFTADAQGVAAVSTAQFRSGKPAACVNVWVSRERAANRQEDNVCSFILSF
eukprot:COSAG02_NODE_1177_length_14052_cov_5.923171_5_plen_88_part_00